MKTSTSRRPVAVAVALLLLGVLALDTGVSAPLNPFAAPPPVALGSGQAASGAHCAAPATR